MGSGFDPAEFPVTITEQFFPKKAIITDYGQIERKLYFINKGLVQLGITHDGEESIIEFMSDNSFVSSYTSFLKQIPSDCRITALVECEMEVIHYSDLQRAYLSSLVANKIGRVFTEQIYILKTKREKDFLTKSAQERYAELIAERPDILKLVPVNKIAKYLGVQPESLSRIRKSIIS
jgi:CRP-like cAMP-binding protein